MAALLAATAAAAGCGHDKATTPGGGTGGVAGAGAGGAGTGGMGGAGGATTAALHIISTPVKNARVGATLKYQAVASQPGATQWSLNAAPAGAKLDQGGNLTWTPTDDQGGVQTFTISAALGDQTAQQTFTVTAARAVLETSLMVDPSNPNGATISVDAPLSSVRGTALQIDPGAMPAGSPVGVTISSVDNAPVPPAVLAAGTSAGDLKPVELGPSGLAFQRPVKLQLPISAALASRNDLSVQTFNYDSGRWEKVKLLSVDHAAGVAVAEIQHFSTYAVMPDVKVLDLQANLGGAACSSALVVRATLLPAWNAIPATAINGPPMGLTVADVLTNMPPGQALQIWTRVSARALAGTGAEQHWLLASASKRMDGTFQVSLTSDTGANPLANVPLALGAGDPELLAWMNGSRADLVFGALGSAAAGVDVTADVSLYFVPGFDAAMPPPAGANSLGGDEVTVAAPVPLTGFDDDCDGVPNSWDAAPQGPPPPALVGVPLSPVHVPVGGSIPLTVSSPQPGVAITWASSSPSLTITSAPDGMSATVSPSMPGLFQVSVMGAAGGASTRFTWDVIADPPAVAQANTPPFVTVSASANVVRVGESVVLSALGRDAEQTALMYAWTSPDPTVLSAWAGDTVVFSAARPGDYSVTCTASDGLVTSQAWTVTITVLSATANRQPSVPMVTPISATLTHAPGMPVSIVLSALATDPDGDPLTYDFVPAPATPATFTLDRTGMTAQFTTEEDGAYLFYVTATDPSGAQSPWAPVRIMVMPELAPAMLVDADHDGYPAGIDCDDNDPTRHPNAVEICGDGIDQDCDGSDLGLDQCDRDGDRFTPAQGDCDDNNAAVGPQMLERCDGIDNNCDGRVDEGFDVGQDCVVGVGACQVSARTACSANLVGVVCAGVPGVPHPETCDHIDNDCNGRVDDIPGQLAGDVNNCGGCGISCPTPANGVAACVNGGCSSACAAGFVDADRNPANGCECQLTNGGVEICDGLDNDCNGVIDDGVGGLVYGGPIGTQGVGVCMAGQQACQGGKLVDVRPARLPSAEICDGLDNDCNGRIDDGFDFLSDSQNCGACGIVCGAGTGCNAGKCVPYTNGTPDGGAGGAVGADGGGGPSDGSAGTFGGSDAGSASGGGGFIGGGGGAGGYIGGGGGPGGGSGGGNLTVCPGPTGSAFCTDLNADPANCGACGVVCPTGESCMGGICALPGTPTCPSPSVTCSDPANPTKAYCANLMTDAANCGACGKVCPSGVLCQMGMCTGTGSTCGPATPMACQTPTGGIYCADPNTDAANCGGCGRTCPAGVACQNGMCGGSSGCPATAPNACMNAGMQYCTNLGSDPANCGSCGLACPAGVACQNGMCGGTTTCPPNQPKMCPGPQGTICTDTNSDPQNCGNCGLVCPAGAACQNGMCGGGTSLACGGATPNGCFGPGGELCTNILNDTANCGRCGNVCPTGMGCIGGICNGTAPMGCPASAPVSCPAAAGGTYCADVSSDPANCGACGKACPMGVACQAGACGGGGTMTCSAQAPNACPAATGGSFCTDLSRDAANCGTCGNVCPAGSTCMGAICTTGTSGCAAPLTQCLTPDGKGTICVDLTSDISNCGGCGKPCPAGSSCQMGMCSSGQACPPPTSMACPNGTGGTYCADPTSDAANCGGCGRTCPAGVPCQGGTCGGINCPASQPNACPGGGTPYCTNLGSDPANCGGCGLACAPGAVCQGGMCAGGTMTCSPDKPQMCPSPQGSICTNLTIDPSNCGACGNVCPPGSTCQGATCTGTTTLSCTGATPNGCFGPSGEMCTNVQNDAANCGRCGNVCPTGTACIGGICNGTAPMGCPASAPVNCPAATGGSYCADVSTDPANCGACGKACPLNVACQAGVCGGGGTTMCGPTAPNACPAPTGGTFCTDLSRDSANCGGCGRACPSGMTCSAAMCTSSTGSCAPPQASCLGPDGVTSFCANVMSDPANCGGCGKVCPPGIACQNGACGGQMTCPQPAQMCTDAGGKTFCADVTRDAANCGACGQACPANAICTNGTCQGGSGFYPGLAACLGTGGAPMCTNLLSDPANCGACGIVCGAGQTCSSGQCASPPPPPTSCPMPMFQCDATMPTSYCADFSKDVANCGGCHVVCSPGQACLQGKCG